MPKSKPNASEASKDGQPAAVEKIGMFPQYARKAVERNTAAQVVDVVNADVGR